jgi:hypothetical protein
MHRKLVSGGGTLVSSSLLPVVLLAAGLIISGVHSRADHSPSPELRAMIEEDWAAQERRLGRQAGDAPSIRAALKRAEQLLEDAHSWPGVQDVQQTDGWLKELQDKAAFLDSLDDQARLELYHELRNGARQVALKNPLLAGRPLVFMKRHRFICQMLHEYLGYFYDYGNVEGGGVYVLEEPGRSLTIRDLVKGQLPRGNYATLSLSYDARTVYFAFAERAPKKPDFYSSERRTFHLYSVDAEGGPVRRLTSGPDDDFDPCPLPDGGIAFMSTRRGGFARCNNPWEPIPSYTLHRMNPDGSEVRKLSAHETSEWHPSVLNDGRLIYTRWDYVDRSAAHFHGLWISNPDGSGVTSLFGNYTQRINACFQPRAIPGSDKIAFIAGAHHADVGGSLVVLNPNRVALDPKSGEDLFDSIEKLTPEICFPEAPGCWPKSWFHSPWPLSENYFLAAFSHDPLPGMSSGEKRDTRTGLYYFDRFGNLELLYRDPDASAMYPVPLAPRPVPPVIPGALDPALGEEGEFLLVDVKQSLMPLPSERPVRELRVFQLLPKIGSHVVNDPRIGHANAENARMLLGSVPVETDGSAYFRAPAGKPVYFQAVDEHGRAVQSMRSAAYVQPGERRSCVGCHEPPGTVPPRTVPLAARRAPSVIEPGPDGSRPLSFPRLVQPVLDRHCVRCHDGEEGPEKSKLALTGDSSKPFTVAYQNLKPFLRWYEWGGASISQIATRPGQSGADASPLTRILDDPLHARHVNLSDEERRRIYLWLDANAPFYGTYLKEEQLAQRRGETIAAPGLE